MIGAVAFFISHIEGLRMGLMRDSYQTSELEDIYEGEGEIKTFPDTQGAILWLQGKAKEFQEEGWYTPSPDQITALEIERASFIDTEQDTPDEEEGHRSE